MEFFLMILKSIGEFLKNIPNLLSYFFEVVIDTIDIIPNPFAQIIKVLLAIATAVIIAKTIRRLI